MDIKTKTAARSQVVRAIRRSAAERRPTTIQSKKRYSRKVKHKKRGEG